MKGFSLIEMILIIATLGALSTATYIGFSDNKEISEHKEASAKLKHLKNLILEYSKKGEYPCPAAPSQAGNPDFLKEARDKKTGNCNENSLLSFDSDGISNYGSGYNPPKADFVMGLFPCSSLGEPDDCGQDSKGNYFGYAVSNHKTKKSACGAFANPGNSANPLTTLPTSFGVLTDWDFNSTVEANIKKNVDNSIIAEFYIISYGNGIGSWTKNGDRITPTIVGKNLVNYNTALNMNTDFNLSSQLDNFILIPSKPLSIPDKNLTNDTSDQNYDENEIRKTKRTFSDIIAYGRSSSVITKICVSCKSCDSSASTSIVQVDNFNSCLDVANACKCSNSSQCDAAAGECCETSTGQCGAAYCSVSCTDNSDCPSNQCCDSVSGTCSPANCSANPRCTSDTDCTNGECCSVAKQECSLSYCAADCCASDFCCKSTCAGYNAFTCACNTNACSNTACPAYDDCACNPSGLACICKSSSCANPNCPGYDLCTCNPTDPSCPQQCTKKKDCAKGECCVGNICQPCANLCEDDSDCKKNECCVAGQCTTTCNNPCNNDKDCKKNECCISGQCSATCPASCKDKNDCVSGECCIAKYCTTNCPDTCSANDDCSNGDCCLSNICTTCPNNSCEKKKDCAKGECCNSGICGSCTELDCCESDSCCDSSCSNYDSLICEGCISDSCVSSSCPGYDICTCEPSDPSCNSCNSSADCTNGECCINGACGVCSGSSGASSTSSSSSGSSSSGSGSGSSSTSSSSGSSSGAEPQCCKTDSCCNASCLNYDTCTCNPNDPICSTPGCLVDADCNLANGECCLNKICTTQCGNNTNCSGANNCNTNEACCNGVCINASLMLGGNCPDVSCDPVNKPCPQGYICCSGFCEEAKLTTIGTTGILGSIIGTSGGTLDLPSTGGINNPSSSSSTVTVTISPGDACSTCQNSNDCPSGFCCFGVCSNSPCQQTCDGGEDCDPTTPYCCSGVCQAAPCSCTNNSQCSGQTPYCCNNYCQSAPCSCQNNNQCPSGTYCCDGQCQASPCPCTNNSQCPGSKPYCCNGTCQPQNCCTNNSQCPTGECCNTQNGQCSEFYCVPNCCSTDSCCSQYCPGYNEFDCACDEDPCVSTFCPDYNFCTCNPGYCQSSSTSSTSSTSSSSGGGNGCPGQCNNHTLLYACGPAGCCSQTGSIQWENHSTPCSNTVPSGFTFDTSPAAGSVITSGSFPDPDVGYINWEFVFIGMVYTGCPSCTVQPMCGFRVTNTCNVLTLNNNPEPDIGNYLFPITCKFGVDYGTAEVIDTDINDSNQGSEGCSLGIRVVRFQGNPPNPSDTPIWLSASTVGCGAGSSSGCGTLDGFCRNSLKPYPTFPVMCPMSP